jgi:hypothetical protein
MPLSGRSPFGSARAVADLHDVDQRQLRHGLAVRMGVPFVAAARQPADAAAGRDRVLDLLSVPLGHGFGQRLARGFPRTRDTQRALAMMRMVGVQEHRAPVARRVMAGQGIPRDGLLAVLQHVGVRPQRRRRGMAIDGDGLRLAGAQPPQVGGGEAHGAQRRRARARDAPGRDEHRVFAAGQRQRIVRALLAAELAQHVVGKALGHLPLMISVKRDISTSGQVMCGLWLASIS